MKSEENVYKVEVTFLEAKLRLSDGQNLKDMNIRQ